MTEHAEREDLEQLVSSAGWGRFLSMVDEQWGSGGARYRDAVTSAARIGADADAINQLRQIIAAQREIQLVMGMVDHRLKLLKQPQLVPVGQSRRGGL